MTASRPTYGKKQIKEFEAALSDLENELNICSDDVNLL